MYEMKTWQGEVGEGWHYVVRTKSVRPQTIAANSGYKTKKEAEVGAEQATKAYERRQKAKWKNI